MSGVKIPVFVATYIVEMCHFRSDGNSKEKSMNFLMTTLLKNSIPKDVPKTRDAVIPVEALERSDTMTRCISIAVALQEGEALISLEPFLLGVLVIKILCDVVKTFVAIESDPIVDVPNFVLFCFSIAVKGEFNA